MKITWTVWPRELPSTISLAKSLARVEYELAKCHFSLASGRPQDLVTSRRISVGVADTLQYMARRAREAPQMQDNVISGYYCITFHNQAKVRAYCILYWDTQYTHCYKNSLYRHDD